MIRMRRFHILLALSSALLCLLPGCTAHRYPQALLQADSLSEVRPDSSMLMLEAMKDQMDAAPEADRMYYRLLRIKAADKADKMVPDTSEVAQLLTYYESAKDSLLPTAYYYAGRTYYDLNNMPQALHYFQKAVDEIEAIRGNSRKYILLKKVCYSQMGYIFTYQHIYNEAQKMSLEAIKCAKLINDTLGLAYGYRDLAFILGRDQQYESELNNYQKANYYAQLIGDESMQLSINIYIANCYRYLGKLDSASVHIRTVLKHIYLADSSATYLTAARIYYEKKEWDSAHYFFHQVEQHGGVYAKESAYEFLLEDAIHRNDTKSTSLYYNFYKLYNDSVKKIRQAEVIARILSQHYFQIKEEENQRLERANHRQFISLVSIGFVGLLAIIAMTILIIILQIYKREHIIQSERYKNLLQIKEKDYRRSAEYINKNKERIAELEIQLKSANEDKTELRKQLEREKERLMTNNMMAEISIKQEEQSLIHIKDSNIYRRLNSMTKSEHPTDDEWKDLEYLLNSECDNFCNKLKSIYKLSVIQYRISLLIKIGIDPARMAFMLNTSKQNISTIRMRLYQVVFGKKGRAKDWDAYIKSL